MGKQAYDGYSLPANRVDWNSLLQDWQPLIPRDATPWILTQFGDVLFKEDRGQIGMLDTGSFGYSVVAGSEIEFEELIQNRDNLSAWFLTPLVDSLRRAGTGIVGDRCYSFVTPPGFGGALEPANVMCVPVREHFGLWGSVYQQIKDLPPGAEVVLKVK